MTPDEMNERITPEELETSCRQYRQELIMVPLEALRDETAKHITILPGVRNSLTWGELDGDAELGPWSSASAEDADYSISGRTLQVWPGNCAKNFDPMEVFQSIYGESIALGQSMTTHQIARKVAALLAARIGKHLDKDAVFNGVRNVKGRKTKDLFDGFDTIIAKEIAAEKLSEANNNYMKFTGAIDNTSAVDAAKEFWRKAAPYLRDHEVEMHVPEWFYWAYIDDYQVRHGALPYNTEYDKFTLEGSDGKCRFCHITAEANTKYLKLTTKKNLILGTDINSQENHVSIQKYSSWKLTFEYAAVYGAQIRSLQPELLFVAELNQE